MIHELFSADIDLVKSQKRQIINQCYKLLIPNLNNSLTSLLKLKFIACF